jgi:hypothetical protein
MPTCMIMLAIASSGCRDDDEEVSGKAYVCACAFPPAEERDEVLVNACAITTGEAMDLAGSCVATSGFPSPQYCDCSEDAPRFCTIGACSLRK